MKFNNAINQFLAASISWLNALVAVFLVVVCTAVSIELIGGFGMIVGPLVGAAFAVIMCGALAVLISIRDQLAATHEKSELLSSKGSVEQ